MTKPATPDPREWAEMREAGIEFLPDDISESYFTKGWDACLDQIARPLLAELEELRSCKDAARAQLRD